MSFGFEKPCIHKVHSIAAEATSWPDWQFAALTLTFKDAEGNETELEVYLPKERAAYVKELAAAINDAGRTECNSVIDWPAEMDRAYAMEAV